jgi:arsenate reductase
MLVARLLSVVAASLIATLAIGGGNHVPLNTTLDAYLDAREAEFDRISHERRELLEKLSAYVRSKADSSEAVNLIFVCTHNSRRSHMSQLWAAAAAARYGIDAWTYSGGTESTAFNPRAVAAIERAGFEVEKTTEARNPVYHVRMNDDMPAMTCFSKPYDNDPNPSPRSGRSWSAPTRTRPAPPSSGPSSAWACRSSIRRSATGRPKRRRRTTSGAPRSPASSCT